ncbi:MAG: error-prone polymerase, partial [Mycobacterium sp.]|nr:error-prone polymerase [Mycobacterium sp.]
MGWGNPAVPWSELERVLSGRPAHKGGHPRDPGHPGDGGDSPAWSRTRTEYVPPAPRRPGKTPYAELHAHSNFSFLDGASHPENLVEEAARLGLDAVAITDHDGMYGVV